MNSREYSRRRRHLMDLMGVGGIAVLPAAPERVRSRDTLYGYRPDSDFYYLTGFEEPDAVAALIPGRPQGEFILFCRERDAHREAWDGARAGPHGAVADYGADDAFPVSDLEEILPGLFEPCERVYYSLGSFAEFDQRILGWMNALHARRQSGHAPNELVALDPLLHEMRLFKSRAEASTMRRAARIAVAAHRRAMQVCRPGMVEYELEAEFLHEFRRHGAECSYPPIVAGGASACVLHYRDNNARLADGELVLIDAGCEHELYASDVTCTFPVNGRFTSRQRELYEIVYAAARSALQAAQPGNHWNDPHQAAVKEITRGMRDVGLLQGRLPTLLKRRAYSPYFMHRTGHWLGLDVHDVGDYRVGDQWRLIEPGMVMTIEPGIYIPPGAKGRARRWRGTGIRIEDDVLISRKGPEVLSQGLPRLPEEIERFMESAE
jgi:Xaa-Pro aminopeptidase